MQVVKRCTNSAPSMEIPPPMHFFACGRWIWVMYRASECLAEFPDRVQCSCVSLPIWRRARAWGVWQVRAGYGVWQARAVSGVWQARAARGLVKDARRKSEQCVLYLWCMYETPHVHCTQWCEVQPCWFGSVTLLYEYEVRRKRILMSMSAILSVEDPDQDNNKE